MANKINRDFNIKLRKFDMKKITKGKVVAIYGKRQSGKSTLVKDILQHVGSIPTGTIICPSEKANEFYSTIIPPVAIHTEYSKTVLDKFVERQKCIAHKHVKEIDKYGRSSVDPHAFIVLDECVYDNSWTRDSNINFLFMNSRHLEMLVMFTMQYYLSISPSLRTNIDYIFILKDNNQSNRKKLYEYYAGVFPNFDTFCEFMNQCTENYGCLVIDNTKDSINLEDMVFWYKADVNIDIPYKLETENTETELLPSLIANELGDYEIVENELGDYEIVENELGDYEIVENELGDYEIVENDII
jgi:hypothetical protein